MTATAAPDPNHRVHCSQGGDAWFSGRLGDTDAPEARPTAGQIRTIFRPQRNNVERERRVRSGGRPAASFAPPPDWL